MNIEMPPVTLPAELSHAYRPALVVSAQLPSLSTYLNKLEFSSRIAIATNTEPVETPAEPTVGEPGAVDPEQQQRDEEAKALEEKRLAEEQAAALNKAREAKLEEYAKYEDSSKLVQPQVISPTQPGQTTDAQGNAVKENGFLNERKGSLAYRNGLTRFQAENNLVVDGGYGETTKEALYNPNFKVVDTVQQPPTDGIWLTINKTKKSITVYEGTNVIVKVPVALGTGGTPTPSGKTKVVSKFVNPAWGGMFGKYEPIRSGAANNPLGKRWIGLDYNIGNGYGMHGNYAPFSIGTYASNGCIRMINDDVENRVYPVVPLNAPVWLGTDKQLQEWGVVQSSSL